MVKNENYNINALIDKKSSKTIIDDFKNCNSLFKDYYDLLLDLIEPMFVNSNNKEFPGDPDTYKNHYIMMMLNDTENFDKFIRSYFFIDTHKKILNILNSHQYGLTIKMDYKLLIDNGYYPNIFKVIKVRTNMLTCFNHNKLIIKESNKEYFIKKYPSKTPSNVFDINNTNIEEVKYVSIN